MDKSRDNLSPSCSSSDEVVAYLYDELDFARRSAVDTHLAGCDKCTAELAELSFARLDVYEWHRDEFVEMATPSIAIPFGERKISLLASVRGFFAGYGQLAAGGAFAAVALFAGVWFMSGSRVEVSGLGSTPLPVAAPIEIRPEIVENDPDKPVLAVNPPIAERNAENEKTVPAVAARKPVEQRRPVVRKSVSQPVEARRLKAAPRLNDFEDEDDNTLRLGDLLADLDTED